MRGRSKCRGAKYVTYYHHIHHGIFNVDLDQVIFELHNRFLEKSTQLLRRVACLDPTNEFANFEIERLVELANIYYADFSDYECEKLRTELENFIDEVKHDEEFFSLVLILVALLRRWLKLIDIHISLWCIVSLSLH
jgi:hypothetical protein